MISENPVHDAMIAAALAAGKAILSHYSQEATEARLKVDSSPVTAADEAAEAEIIKILSTHVPSIPIISEEQASAGTIPPESERFFLVDPLDGTKEFISRNGEFTVNIALVNGVEAVAGVVYAPALSRIFFGAIGKGAWEANVTQDKDLIWRSIQAREIPDEGLVAVASRSHAGAETDAYLKLFNVLNRVSAGSSLKFCLIAAGEADIYPRLGRTMEWDTAAGHALLSAAGGCVRTLDGIDLTYGKRNQVSDSAFANPHFIAFASSDLVSFKHKTASAVA
ncbi:3'-5'-bisphosphate nucleotidase [Microvirga vignae]|uniref:3'(2'),5'-bisphosphate nucleotidase CysQ n=1 Tax=Microvirga vignae TaxID=1225564 RepID=A0A0H1REY3_9HYPH|nr:3'(2'),5'-bisphosphate nucleotidase CysQ [Microvirga vignae]KLK93396.1 3'-5'-bisphosphate nucleotidase [Microvirga vignae]